MTAPAAPWEPDPFTEVVGRALQGRIPYAAGSVLAADGEATQRPIPASVDAMARWLRRWPGVTSCGTRRSPAKPSVAGRRRDVHEEGRAIDVMMALHGSPEGDRIASFLVENADRLGVQYVLWRRREWSASAIGAAWEPYDGADPHVSHVHVEVSPAAAAWPREAMEGAIREVEARPRREAAGMSVVGAAVGVAAVAGATWLALRWWRGR